MDNQENKLDQILRGIDKNTLVTEQIQKDIVATNTHLKELNSSVAKNSGWIKRYDIRVAEEVPEIKKSVMSMNVKIASVGGTLTVIVAIVYFLLRSQG